MVNVVGDWVSDYYAENYANEHQTDPKGPSEPLIKSDYVFGRVLRSCINSCTERSSADMNRVRVYAGFRPVLELHQER
jgi:hypothetical protein